MTAASPPIPPNVYLAYTGYVGPDQPSVVQTWLLPPSSVYNAATPAQPLSLPFLYSGSGDISGLKVANADFVLAAQSLSGKPTRDGVTVTLQLTGKNAWNTGAASRAALRQNFLSFLAQVEALETRANPLLIPGATALITLGVLQIMPLPLSETLLYACGLETGIGSGGPAAVDVLPGMRLRREPSLRQYVAPPNQAFSAYQSTGSLAWDVVSTPSGQAFDAFLGATAAPQITPPPASPGALCGLIDLQLANSGYRHHRLVYPQNVPSATAPGDSSAQDNIQLIGANSLADLRGGNPPYVRSFFGRDVVIPEICIWLGTSGSAMQPLYVPLGTTVNNILDRFLRWMPLATTDAQNVVKLNRMIFATSPAGGLNGCPVTFAPQTARYTDLRAFDLPLWPGDALRLSIPSP